MYGAIIGDIAGSPYEFGRALVPDGDYDLSPPDANFTDDTLMTLAVYDGIKQANGDLAKGPVAVAEWMRLYARMYKLGRGGYGGMFREWLWSDNPHPYGSFGNGSAMRVSSVGWLFPTLKLTEQWAEVTAAVTHNHPEGIKGAQAVAASIFLARTGHSKLEIKEHVEHRYGYDLSRSWGQVAAGDINPITCQATVPEALSAVLEADGFEKCLRLAISLGGDTDTRAAIAGSIAEALFGIPDKFREAVATRITGPLAAMLADFEKATLPQRLVAVLAPIYVFLESRLVTSWIGGELARIDEQGHQTRYARYPAHAPELSGLNRRVIEFGVVDFDYVKTVAATNWDTGDPIAVIASADATQLAGILTWYIRQERFIDGLLAQGLAEGHLAAIAHRAFDLAGVITPTT